MARHKDNTNLEPMLLAACRGVPERVSAGDLLSLVDWEHGDSLLTGVIGKTRDPLLALAAKWSGDHRDGGPTQLLPIDALYRTESQIVRAADLYQREGWIHLTDSTKEVLDAIREEWRAWIVDDEGTAAAPRASGLSPEDIALERPDYVARSLARHPLLTAVRFRARVQFACGDEPTILRVVAMRRDAHRIVAASLRCMEGVPVALV